MVSILGIIGVTFALMIFGSGGMYWLWIKTRPKKETWKASIYQITQGVREPILNKDGQVISKIKLQDLIPYDQDVLEKIDKDPGITIYRLQKLNKTTPAVGSEVVEYWGQNDRRVSVLLHKGGCTLLRKGYDKSTGEILFDPLPHSRINLIKGEMAIRKDRLTKEKDILMALTPWVVVGLVMVGITMVSYLMITGFVEMSENFAEAATYSADSLLEVERIRSGQPILPNTLGKGEVKTVKT